MENRIIPECFADTALVEAFGYRNPNHKMGSEVFNTLEKSNYNNIIVVAVIDRDKFKKQPKKLKDKDIYKPIYTKKDIEVRQKSGSSRFVIIHPNLEKWTWDEGLLVNIYPSKYNLTDDFNAYRAIFKKRNAEHNQHVKNFLNALAQADTEIKLVKDLISRILSGQSLI